MALQASKTRPPLEDTAGIAVFFGAVAPGCSRIVRGSQLLTWIHATSHPAPCARDLEVRDASRARFSAQITLVITGVATRTTDLPHFVLALALVLVLVLALVAAVALEG